MAAVQGHFYCFQFGPQPFLASLKTDPAFLLWNLSHPSWFYWIHVLTRKVGPTIPDSYNGFNGRRKMARPAGIEPATHCLEGSCSIQLSYGRPRSTIDSG